MNYTKHIILVLILTTVSSVIYAQPPGSGSSAPCWPPPCIPIDGGVGFLAAAGIAMGVKFLYDKKNKDS
ncbi:MAG: hypothetical protein ACJAUV_000613 [Flavobacteriales bacterium]|jgi:hypothetical protein